MTYLSMVFGSHRPAKLRAQRQHEVRWIETDSFATLEAIRLGSGFEFAVLPR